MTSLEEILTKTSSGGHSDKVWVGKNYSLADLQSDLRQQAAKIERYERALEFYKGFFTYPAKSDCECQKSFILHDRGSVAYYALNPTEPEQQNEEK